MEAQTEIDEKIIDFVKGQSILFDKASRSYKNNAHKDRLWQRLASELGMEVDSVTKRWRTLRDRYAREVKRIEELTRSGAECVEDQETWVLFESLSFLKDHLTRRATTSNYSKEQSSQDNLQEEFLSESFDDTQEGATASGPASSTKRKRKDDIDAKMSNILDTFIANDNNRYAQFAQHVASKLALLPLNVANQVEANIMRLIYDALIEHT
nr:transcription factor Adf-1-like isoform X2 [Aedes albopictus]XP_029724255.1 transcription factor Adf-1 [Aedes albopictus]